MGSPPGFTAQDYAAKYESSDVGDWENLGSSNSDDGLAISELGYLRRLKMCLIRQCKVVLGEELKTLAFGIPVIDKIIKSNAKHGHEKISLSFVLTPKRDPARQFEKFREALSLGGALNRTLSNPLVTSTADNRVLIVEARVFPVLVTLHVYENNKEAWDTFLTGSSREWVPKSEESVDEAWAILSNRTSNLDAKAKIVKANILPALIGNLDSCKFWPLKIGSASLLVLCANLFIGYLDPLFFFLLLHDVDEKIVMILSEHLVEFLLILSYDSFDASDTATEAMTGQYMYYRHAYKKDTKESSKKESTV
ncbi:hypothetical protein Bca101_025993 [Brassica carinata]